MASLENSGNISSGKQVMRIDRLANLTQLSWCNRKLSQQTYKKILRSWQQELLIRSLPYNQGPAVHTALTTFILGLELVTEEGVQ